MRLLAITAGAGAMYCGSCLRDNTLAMEMTARGHDVTLLPTYTPTRTDEENVSGDRVFFGGVSVYLQQHVPLMRHTPAIVDRIWDSAAVLRAVSGSSMASVDPRFLGAMTVSMLRGEDGFQKKEIDKLVGWLQTQPPFDVVVLPNALLLGLAPALARELGRPICCTLQGEDLFLEGLPDADRQAAKELIRGHAPRVARFVAVSDYYAGFMSDYLGIPREAIRTVPLGIHTEGFARAREPPATPTIGYLARIAPEKGLHVLAQAYVRLRREGRLGAARLLAAGYLAPEHRGYLDGVKAELRAAGLESEFVYHGVVDRAGKARFLQSVSVVSVPSPYAEAKGLYVLEAMASGVPVVQPRHGAFPEMVERTGGGVLFEPGSLDGLCDALAALLSDGDERRRLGVLAAEGVRREYAASHMAERAERAYAEVAQGAAASL